MGGSDAPVGLGPNGGTCLETPHTGNIPWTGAGPRTSRYANLCGYNNLQGFRPGGANVPTDHSSVLEPILVVASDSQSHLDRSRST